MNSSPSREWTYATVRQRYLDLARHLGVRNPIPTDIYLRSTSTERVKVKRLLWVIGDGIAAGDKACIEIGIQFVTARVRFHYAVSIRAIMVKRLEEAILTADQSRRIRASGYPLRRNKHDRMEDEHLIPG